MRARLVALGGLGEFGANCLVFEAPGGERVLVDAGVAFSELEPYGVSFELPDFAALPGPAPEALLCTHAHDDHGKALPWLLDAFPDLRVCGSRATLARLNVPGGARTTVLEGGGTVRIGPWRIDAASASHSIPGALFLRVRDGGTRGIVVATDFRLAAPAFGEPTDEKLLATWGEEGVDLLLLDSTNAVGARVPPEEDAVEAALRDQVRGARGAVIAVTFASHVGRCRQLARAAAAAGRVAVPLGRGIVEALRIQASLGGLGLAPGVLRPERELGGVQHDGVVVLATGSQGEPGSAFARLAVDRVPGFRIEPGDRVLHAARVIPGRERVLEHLFDHCVRRGAEVVTAAEAPIHASGHPHPAELERVIELLRPRWVMPVHGRRRNLEATATLARRAGVAAVVVENGTEVVVGDGAVGVGAADRSVGRVLMADDGQRALDPVLVRERRTLGREGVVVAIVVGAAAGGGRRGVVVSAPGTGLTGSELDELGAALTAELVRAAGHRGGEDELHSTMARWLRREVQRRTGRRRIVELVMVEP